MALLQSRATHLGIKATQRLDKVCGPAHMKDRRGTPLLPLADAVIKTQQMGKALGVLQCRDSRCLLGLILQESRGARLRPHLSVSNIHDVHLLMFTSFYMYSTFLIREKLNLEVI